MLLDNIDKRLIKIYEEEKENKEDKTG